jgi:dolichol-phosphate mannosyltransferase
MTPWDDSALPEVSVVLPCFDEAGNLESLLREIHEVMTALRRPFEILVIDDCSRDDTAAVAERVGVYLPEVRVVRHARNCGQSAALGTGFRVARGALVLTLDGDGQNDPASIPDLFAALGDADAVCGVRRKRQDSTAKKLASKVGNGFRRLVTRDVTTDAGCNFRLLRREALAELPIFNGTHRWMGALLRYQGFRVVECEVKSRPRRTGVSKYNNLERGVRGIFDCIAMLWFRRRLVPGRRANVSVERAVQR